MFQQLLVEALLLAAAGGALGLLLAHGTLTSASTLLASQVPRAEEIPIDARVLLFVLGKIRARSHNHAEIVFHWTLAAYLFRLGRYCSIQTDAKTAV